MFWVLLVLGILLIGVAIVFRIVKAVAIPAAILGVLLLIGAMVVAAPTVIGIGRDIAGAISNTAETAPGDNNKAACKAPSTHHWVWQKGLIGDTFGWMLEYDNPTKVELTVPSHIKRILCSQPTDEMKFGGSASTGQKLNASTISLYAECK